MDSGEMRAVEVTGTQQRFKVTATGCVPLNAGITSEGMVSDVNTAGAVLSQLFKDNGFTRGTPVTIGAKSQNVLLRMAPFPNVPSDKMRNAVLYQAQKFIPIPVAELMLDYVECEKTESNDVSTVNVLLVGAKKIFLDNMLALFDKAARSVADIDSALLATMRAVSVVHESDGLPYLFLDVDHENLGMMICRDDTVLMARTAVHPSTFSTLTTGFHEQIELTDEALDGAAGYLSEGIRTSMMFFATQSGSSVGRVYMIGRFRQIDEIARRVGERLGIEVILPHLYPDALLAEKSVYGTCVSLALRGLEV